MTKTDLNAALGAVQDLLSTPVRNAEHAGDADPVAAAAGEVALDIQNPPPVEHADASEAPSVELKPESMARELHDRTDVARMIEQFAEGTAGHPIGLTLPPSPSSTSLDADFNAVNAVLRAASSRTGVSEDQAAAGVSLTTPQAQRLSRNIAAIMAAADQRHVQAQSAAAMHVAAHLQTSADHFANPKAAQLVGNELFHSILVLLAAERTNDLQAAEARVRNLLERLDGMRTPGCAVEAEIAQVIRNAAERIVENKRPGLAILDAAGRASDGSMDLKDAKLGYVRNDRGGFESPALRDLHRFGICSAEREEASAVVARINTALKSTTDAVAEGRLMDACEEAAETTRLNREAGDLSVELIRAAAIDSAVDAAARLLGSEPPSTTGANPALTAAEAGDRLGAAADWPAIALTPGSGLAPLVDGVADALGTLHTPQGAYDRASADLHEPVLSPRLEVLCHALLADESLNPAVRDDVAGRLAALGNASAGEKLREFHDALELIHRDLSQRREAAEGAGTTAMHKLLAFGIDAQHPEGAVQGGLAGFAASLRLEDYAPSTDADGRPKPPAHSPAVFKRMMETLAEGYEADAPAMSELLRAETNRFMLAAEGSERQAAFGAIRRMLIAAGGPGGLGGIAPLLTQSSNPAAASNAADPRRTLLEMLRSTDGAELARNLQSALENHVSDRAALETLGSLAEAFGTFEPRAAHAFEATSFAARYLGALGYNDFFRTALGNAEGSGASSRLTLESLDRAAHPALGACLDAAQAFRTQPSASTLLGFMDKLGGVDAEDLKHALAEAVVERLDAERPGLSPQAQAARHAELQAESDLLAAQFDVLRRHPDAMFYAAHALYAAERGTDPNDISPESSGNRAFVEAFNALSSPLAERCRPLLGSGIRGEHRLAATRAALASLKVTAAHLGRQEIFEAFGATTDVNVGRALRFFDARMRPGAGYDATTDLDALKSRFRSAVQNLPVIRELRLAESGAVADARAFQSERLRERMEVLHMSPEAVARIENGVDVSAPGLNADALAGMHGQTAGLALMLLQQTLLSSVEDLPSEAAADLLGRQPQMENGRPVFSDADLRDALHRTALRPLHERETAVLLHELMTRSQKTGAANSFEDVLRSLEPRAPSPETLSLLAEDERAGAVAAYNLDVERFKLETAALRNAYLHHAASDADVPAGRPSLAQTDPQTTMALLQALRGSALSSTLMKSSAKAQESEKALRTAVGTAYDNLLATLASGTTDAGALSAAKRELYAALGVGRFNRGRYVLLAKTHNLHKPKATQEFKDAWAKLGLKPTPLTNAAKARLESSIAPQMGELARIASSAQGITTADNMRAYLADIEDPKVRLAVTTAFHCALELAAGTLGTSVDALVMSDPTWTKHPIAAADIKNVRADQPQLRELLDAKGPTGSVTLAQIVQAHLSTLLPEQAAAACVSAFTADNAQGACAMSRSLFMRNQILRKTKYFEGLVQDIQRSLAQGASFSQLRDSRGVLFHERQRRLFASCLEGMAPGSSVAIDKKGHFQVLGASLEIGKEREADGGKTVCSAKLEAGLAIDLSDAVVFTKGRDNFVTVGVTKTAGISASGSASAEAGVAQEVNAGRGTFSAGVSVQAEASASLSAEYALTVENRLNVEQCAVFMDRMISGDLHAEDLNQATLAHHVGVAAEISVDVGASAALGFEMQSAETEPDQVEVSRLADGSTVTTSQSTDKDGNVTSVSTTEYSDGRKESLTEVRDANGRLTSSKHEATDANGNTTTNTSKREWSAALSKGFQSPTELLETSASVKIGVNGGVSARRTSRSTPVTNEIEYAFSGSVTLRASASAHQAGLEAVSALAGKEPNLERSAAVKFAVDNSYLRVDGTAAGRTIGAVKQTRCTFEDDAPPSDNAQQLSRLLRAQGLPPEKAEALTTLAALSGLPVKTVALESSFSESFLPSSGTLGNSSLFDGAKYKLEKITLGFESTKQTTPLATRVLNQVGRALNGAFEFTTTATTGQEIVIDAASIERISIESITHALSAA